MNQAIRTFRTPASTLGIRQHVLSGGDALSKKMIRPMAIILFLAITVVFVTSQFFHWRIVHEKMNLEQLQSVRREVGSENIRLLATRANLMSEAHVEALAAVRLQLYHPEKGQQHRL
jgi:cell division protein FtsL